jgi:hypothetical protein
MAVPWALKVADFAVASEAGRHRPFTHNHAAGDAMIALNEWLGYRHVSQGHAIKPPGGASLMGGELQKRS